MFVVRTSLVFLDHCCQRHNDFTFKKKSLFTFRSCDFIPRREKKKREAENNENVFKKASATKISKLHFAEYSSSI